MEGTIRTCFTVVLFLFLSLIADMVCGNCHCCSSDEVSAVRRLLEKVDLQGYQVMDASGNLNSASMHYRLHHC